MPRCCCLRHAGIVSSTGWREIQKQKVSEAYGGVEVKASKASGLRRLREFPGAIKNLLLNPTFVCLSLGGGADGAFLHNFVIVLVACAS